jgi:hypothetical protein
LILVLLTKISRQILEWLSPFDPKISPSGWSGIAWSTPTAFTWSVPPILSAPF